jgi:hypothetical protein
MIPAARKRLTGGVLRPPPPRPGDATLLQVLGHPRLAVGGRPGNLALGQGCAGQSPSP